MKGTIEANQKGLTAADLADALIREQTNIVSSMRLVLDRHPELAHENVDDLRNTLGAFRWERWQLELGPGDWAAHVDADPDCGKTVHYFQLVDATPDVPCSRVPALERAVRVFGVHDDGARVFSVLPREFDVPLGAEQVERARAAGWPATLAEFVKVL